MKVYNKDDKMIKEIRLSDDDLVNKRFNRKKSVLDILLDNDVEIFFGCMGGSCSACVCELMKGEENIDREGIHPQVYRGIAEDEFLTCIATIKENLPESAEIELRTKYN